MRFTFALGSLAALVATAAAAPAPASTADSQYGSWALNYTWDSAANGWKTEKFAATYSLDSSVVTQTWVNMPGEGESTVSDPQSFSAKYDGTTVTLQNTVLIENTNVTIIGSAPLATKCNSATGRLCTGSATVEVTQAVA